MTKLSQDQTHFTQVSKEDPHEVQQHSLSSRIVAVSQIHACVDEYLVFPIFSQLKLTELKTT